MANGYGAFQDFAPQYWGDILQQFEPAQYYGSPRGQRFGFIPGTPISLAERQQRGALYDRGASPGMSPRKRRFFESSYDDILRDYYTKAGSALYRGQAPQTFMQFLSTDPWTARYSRLPQYERGMTRTATNPRTRFLFNY